MSRRYMRGAAFASKGNVRVESKLTQRQNWRIEAGTLLLITATNVNSVTAVHTFNRPFGQIVSVVINGYHNIGSKNVIWSVESPPGAANFTGRLTTVTGGVFASVVNATGRYIAIGTD